MMRVHRLLTTALATLGVLAGALVFSGPPALAAVGYGFTGSFGGATSTPADPEPLSDPAGVAVNDTTGDVYVVDRGDNRVQHFSSTGAYIGQFDGSTAPTGAFSAPEAIAVDNSGSASDPSKADVYVTDTGHGVIDKFSASGTYLGQIAQGAGGAPLGTLDGVGVDANGLVWVYINGIIDSFGDEEPNTLLSSRSSLAAGAVEPGFAVDSEDSLYVVHRRARIVAKLNSAGEVLAEPGEELGGAGPKTGIAVELSNNDVYLDNGTSVGEFATNGATIQEFGSNPLADDGGDGIAVSAAGVVYVADSIGDRVDVFTEVPAASTAPEAPLTEMVSGETANSAVLHGELNPNAKAEAGWSFAYNRGSGCTGGASTLAEPEIEVQAANESRQITGLEPNTQYTACFVAENVLGSTLGSAVPFMTSPAPPEVVAGSETTSGVTPFEATLEAQINPNNEETTYSFEYSTTEAAGELTGAITALNGAGPLSGHSDQTASVSTGPLLRSGTTYYYRMIAVNEGGEKTEGKVEQLTTLTATAPLIESETSSVQVPFAATLEAVVNPDYQETTCDFEYGTEPLLEPGTATTVPCEPDEHLGTGDGGVGASVALTGLKAGETYYYRVVTENETSKLEGKPHTGTIESFTTQDAPHVSTGEAQNITRTTATFSGTVNPVGVETTYYFAYIDQAGYERALAGDPDERADPYAAGETTAPIDAGSSFETQAVGPIVASAMLPGTTYHYALIARNELGVTTGSDETVTTAPATPPVVSTGAVSAISQSTATLSGTVDTNSLQTEYGFEIGTEPGSYGPATGLGSLGGATTETVTLTLGELQPGTTYYYRVTATNADGTSYGAEETFTTPGFPTLTAAPVSLPLIATPVIEFPMGSEPVTKPEHGKAKKKTVRKKHRKARKKAAGGVKKGKR